MDYSEKLLIRSIFSYEIRDSILGNLEEYMFEGRVERTIFNYFRTLGKEKIDDKTTFLLKTRSGLSDLEVETMEKVYSENYNYICEDFESAIKEIEKIIINKRLVNTIKGNLKKNNNSLVVDDSLCSKLKNDVEFEISPEKTLFNFHDNEDIGLISSHFDLLSGAVIKSKFEVINLCLNSGGYVPGDLVCWAASSGTGKSTSALDESINFIKQGKKVLYVTLGDMKPATTLLRMLANLDKTEQREVKSDWFASLQRNRHHFSNFRNLVLEAGENDINQIITKVSRIERDFKFDLLVIDYDANIRNHDSSMSYDFYGTVYTKLKAFAMTHDCITFVLSQIKITEYDNEILDKNCLSDSSKKANQLDLLVTLGKNTKNPDIGTLNLAKVRDGVSKYCRIKFDNWKSTITEISDEDYEDLKSKAELSVSSAIFG